MSDNEGDDAQQQASCPRAFTACPANMTPTQQEQQQTGAAAQASKSLDMLSRLGV
jgi:hypothetical protein